MIAETNDLLYQNDLSDDYQFFVNDYDLFDDELCVRDIPTCTNYNDMTSIRDDLNSNRQTSQPARKERKSCLNFITANARSLAPKMQSLIDCFSELELHFAIISESWLKDGKALNDDLADLEGGEGLKMVMNNRRSRRGKIAGGGVAVVFDASKIKLTERRFRRGRAELTAAVGKLPGMSRRLAVFSGYIPPRTRVKQTEEFMGFLNGAVAELKEDYEDPLIVIGGDFNGREVSDAVADFPDIIKVVTGPTRGDKVLDLVLTNIEPRDMTTTVRDPLDTDNGEKKSDHSIVYTSAEMLNVDRFKTCLLYTSPSPRDRQKSRMPSSA